MSSSALNVSVRHSNKVCRELLRRCPPGHCSNMALNQSSHSIKGMHHSPEADGPHTNLQSSDILPNPSSGMSAMERVQKPRKMNDDAETRPESKSQSMEFIDRAPSETPQYVTGSRLASIVAIMALGCFLMLLDTMVISTVCFSCVQKRSPYHMVMSKMYN